MESYSLVGERMIIPHEELQPETLEALIEEFVTRDGAVHGHRDTPIEARVASMWEQLRAGRAVVVFDEETETASIAMRDSLREAEAARGDTSAEESQAPEEPPDYEPFNS